MVLRIGNQILDAGQQFLACVAHLLGTSPLIMNRFQEKEKRRILSIALFVTFMDFCSWHQKTLVDRLEDNQEGS